MTEEINLLRATNARLRAALQNCFYALKEEHIYPHSVHPNFMVDILSGAAKALSSDASSDLAAIREAIAAIEGGSERGGVFWRENASAALRERFGDGK